MHNLFNILDTETSHPALSSISIDRSIATSITDVDNELTAYNEPTNKPDNCWEQFNSFVLNEGL